MSKQREQQTAHPTRRQFEGFLIALVLACQKEFAMKKMLSRMLLTTLALTLLCSIVTAAQSQTAKDASQTTVTGCLSGPNDEGAYVLTQSKGHAIEVGGNDQLKEHVGHTVRLTGSWAKSGSEIGENESAEKNEKAEGSEHRGVAERHFKVTDIHHISDSCSQTGGTGATKQ